MGKFINLNNTHIIDIAEIQSIEFTTKEIGTLYGMSKLAQRYTQLTGKQIDIFQGTKLKGTYDKIEIELKSGHIIKIEDFDLKNLREYLISLLGSVKYFECAELKYTKPDSDVYIDGKIEVEAQLTTGDYPLDLALITNDTIDVKIEK
ncbi:MAG: hypothetical protein JGK17_16190 [Microcoleus sp. PH2017_10_PVI_O_A]|uniref:hypothetical protein n=1 Tax=unclassified Microcoleus TaxID=2642155 RepID=UPI001E03A843|nr:MULTISPECIES: hypothetical protein [unclassified Microcoleus]TAE81638.1 MAG: hypothetical protein EAZ83_14600 [Oscillatoriales cyanobacterium]MCC3407100.1 hypothetical protein [Microcoleus sp. PH2017_10_PVI_O_A]MCC3461110.1 hypothetical protein [Microcoleus sp. PH2017_11_PCY_U_A]MCC3479627.1 hypothetical protein [Microcoleus sp. PH2017_12_PCY_D_A]MCC3529732.1 hypothetical protein [Microcoleus sp. PH2017_21_RUC_O_A]